MNPTGPDVHFLNIEYFFRLLYDTSVGADTISGRFSNLLVLLSQIWLLVTIISILVSLLAIGLMVYSTMRLYQIRAMEADRYTTLSKAVTHGQVEHTRWLYIKNLIESAQESDWRQAIIEADIMLDEMLTRIGLSGTSIGEKLKSANPNHFGSLQNAWEAHKVRNEIAHQGSSYQLSNSIAYRTIANYEATFREFGEI